MEYVLLVIGLIILIKGADFLIEGSSSIAKKFGVPTIVIGLTIVAFGTSLPEFLVNIIAASKGSTEMAFGNIVGSNIANILLILGITALIRPQKVKRSTTWKEIPFGLLGAVALLIFANDKLIDRTQISMLSRIDGLALILFMIIFLYYLIEITLKNKTEICETNETETKILPTWKTVFYIIIGLVTLYFGGRWAVDSAVTIARNFGMSEYLISATIVALGTSLPELATSVKAALKNQSDLAIGNIVGSNIFNIFFVLGVTALIIPVVVPASINFDLIFLAIISLLLFLFMFIGKKHQLERWQGSLFLAGYLFYIIFIVMRG
ncbi:MAG: calcium/sodium antiporter [Patescibacteria group bacterium]